MDEKPPGSARDEPVSIPLDPEEALKALLKVEPKPPLTPPKKRAERIGRD